MSSKKAGWGENRHGAKKTAVVNIFVRMGIVVWIKQDLTWIFGFILIHLFFPQVSKYLNLTLEICSSLQFLCSGQDQKHSSENTTEKTAHYFDYPTSNKERLVRNPVLSASGARALHMQEVWVVQIRCAGFGWEAKTQFQAHQYPRLFFCSAK